MHTLLIADDHPLFREAIGNVIETGLPETRLLETDSLAATLQQLTAQKEIDLLLLDLGLPDAEGLSGLECLRQRFPELPIAIVSADQERHIVLGAIEMGAVGYIPKSTPRQELLAALLRILEGHVYLPSAVMRRPPTPRAVPDNHADHTTARLAQLTDKQFEVLQRLSQGASNKVIARELDIAETTVKTHVSAILRKLEVSSRMQAIVLAGQMDPAVWQARRG